MIWYISQWWGWECDGRFGAHDWVGRFLLRGALGRPPSAPLFGALQKPRISQDIYMGQLLAQLTRTEEGRKILTAYIKEFLFEALIIRFIIQKN